jgi:hypothetical protein
MCGNLPSDPLLGRAFLQELVHKLALALEVPDHGFF